MPREMTAAARRPRITVDVDPALRRRLRLAAAKRDETIRDYVLRAVEDRLREDRVDEQYVADGLLVLSARADPVLAELWDNEKDSAYDRL